MTDYWKAHLQQQQEKQKKQAVINNKIRQSYATRKKEEEGRALDTLAMIRLDLHLLFGTQPPEYVEAEAEWLGERPGVTRSTLCSLDVWQGTFDDEICLAVPLLRVDAPDRKWGVRLFALQGGQMRVLRDIRFDHVPDDETGVLSPEAAAVFGDDAGAADTTIDETKQTTDTQEA